ncbi:hypothetical protein [Planomonospora parontospora]|uniref:hypothetical protein n=1 Tax=Planomonospora parontospora TaxID=58119 RepID=UPI0019438208|nr:hypothetical protein [Planomonospora parontospora]
MVVAVQAAISLGYFAAMAHIVIHLRVDPALTSCAAAACARPHRGQVIDARDAAQAAGGVEQERRQRVDQDLLDRPPFRSRRGRTGSPEGAGSAPDVVDIARTPHDGSGGCIDAILVGSAAVAMAVIRLQVTVSETMESGVPSSRQESGIGVGKAAVSCG